MNSAFILHLRGPLQSYDDRGFGPIREAGAFPSRSAVIGLVAAAQGLPRNDDRLVHLHDALLVHAATVRPGAVRTDFHTVDAGGKNKTVTYRDYHHDAHFVVLVEARTPSDADLLEAAQSALRSPYYVAYLGRRACPPSRPLWPEAAEHDHVLGALVRAAETAGTAYRHRARGGFRLYLDGRVTRADVEAAWPGARLVGHGERRDRLAGPRRTYVGRSYTEVRVQLPTPAATDPQQAYFDAAS